MHWFIWRVNREHWSLFDVLGACAYLLTVTNTDEDMDQMDRMTVATRCWGVLLGVG